MLRWQVEPTATGSAVAARIAENLDLFQAILDGYTCKLNNHSNYVGHFTDAAEVAKEELESQFEIWDDAELDDRLLEELAEEYA